MKTFVISDTHFNHKKLIEYEGRPENFNELIISNWNKMVKPDDLVVHLGDVILGQQSQLPEIMQQLNGTKILCRGNHDKEKAMWYQNRGFSFACDYFVLDGIAFSHVPLTPLPNDVLLNIHGHFHRGKHRNKPDILIDEYYDYDFYKAHEEKYLLIQIENELRPYSLDEVMTHNRQFKT